MSIGLLQIPCSLHEFGEMVDATDRGAENETPSIKIQLCLFRRQFIAGSEDGNRFGWVVRHELDRLVEGLLKAKDYFRHGTR